MVNLKKKLLELYKSYVTSYITIISHAKGGDHANGILGIFFECFWHLSRLANHEEPNQ